MDGYATAYVAHNIPLLVVSGLDTASQGTEGIEAGGVKIASELPCVDTEDGQALLRHFRNGDASNLAWNAREYSARDKFRVMTVGRDYLLPPRYAPVPTTRATSPGSKPVLHSVLSPLSPGSSLYPDGLLDSKWIEKHQEHVPSAFIAFYAFTSDPKLSTLHDNQLKTDITSIKNKLSQSGYKTRLIVALLSEKSVVQSPEAEDRLAIIRKATGLDSKTSLFFLPPKSSAVELKAFVETIISTIYPICIEYYRDLSKHTRRKRNRGIVPPPTAPPTSGTSQTLSSQGWNVRYDFKLGVFAEFRQEMDAAVRSYESGYEGLLGPDVLEAIATWSPRFNEARLLADIFALRSLRCLLWNGNTTAAVRRWQFHRERMLDFVDRRGKGSATYAWKAWESRWASIMAEMIQRVSLTEFSGPIVYLPADKTVSVGERIEPWEFLHHAGYWFRAASRHLMARRSLALAIPEEDRYPPSASSASQLASKAYTYDTYLCPEPHEEFPLPGNKGVDHSALIIDLLNKSISEFEKRDQTRLMQELQLLSAHESMKQENWDAAVRTLRPLWQKMSYREEGWWNAAEEIGWLLRKAAAKAGDGGSIVAVDWEMMENSFTYHPNWHYDLSKSLTGIETIKSKPTVVLHKNEIHSFLSATYTFEYAEGKVGEQCCSQLKVVSSALPSAAPVAMAEVEIVFEGSMKTVILTHQEDDSSEKEGKVSLTKVTLVESLRGEKPTLTGEASLIFRPGQTKIFEFSTALREAGDAKAISATFSMTNELFDLEYVHNFEDPLKTPNTWWGDKSIIRRIVRVSPSSITILPKPPRLQLLFLEVQEQYYTNEEIILRLEVVNDEEVDTKATLEVSLLGEGAPLASIRLPYVRLEPTEDYEGNLGAGKLALRKLSSGISAIVEIVIPSTAIPSSYDLTVNSLYHLVTDMETPVYQTANFQLSVVTPFEANYDFSPRIHPDPWPSLFTHTEGEDSPSHPVAQGLAQKWCLAALYTSFASTPLIVSDVSVSILGVNGGIQCTTSKLTPLPSNGLIVPPKSLDQESQFSITTQKLSLDDRGTATLDVSLSITWRRSQTSPLNTTHLPIPRLLVSSSEPRVLASISYSPSSILFFDIYIENPSNHFLTFGVTMEPSEKFAFSGTKQTTLQLVPLERRRLRWRLVPMVRGEWVSLQGCMVRDRYFQKVLRILGTEGMRTEEGGLVVWVPPAEEEEEEEEEDEDGEEGEEEEES